MLHCIEALPGFIWFVEGLYKASVRNVTVCLSGCPEGFVGIRAEGLRI